MSTSTSYYDTGQPYQITSPNGMGTVAYDSATQAFITSYTAPTPSSGIVLAASRKNDPVSGVVETAADVNSAQTTYKSYDSLLRPTEIDFPDGGKTVYSYTPTLIDAHLYQTASTFTDRESYYDSYGRPVRQAVANGQSGSPYYQQDTCYDANGNTSFVSSSYSGSGTSGSPVCTNTGDAYSFDALGRIKKVVHVDGTFATYTYNGRAMQYTDENGSMKITQMDGLGRVVSVCEVTSSTSMPGSGSPAACNLDIAGTGFLTTYAYSQGNTETTVTQGAQTRVFQSDWLGRPISVQEPESGITTYAYAYNSTGLSVTRSRSAANQNSATTLTTTTTQYDSVGRPLSIRYSDETPSKNFAYDAPSGWAEAGQQKNLKGRLSLHQRQTAGGAASSIFGYDTMGRVTLEYSCTPSGCGNAAYDRGVASAYDYQGSLISEGDGAGDTYSYTRSPAGEITGISSSLSDATDPADIVVPGSVVNSVNGPTSYGLGNGLSTAFTYDTQGRNNGGWVCKGSTQSYCSGGSAQIYGDTLVTSGNLITQVCDTVMNACNGYGYDGFNRLTQRSVQGGSDAGFTYTYDRYGNRWGQAVTSGGGPQPQYTFTASNNQIVGLSYDASGNLLNDGSHSYAYDGDNNLVSVDGGSTAKYYFDSLNHRVGIVRGGSGGSYEFVFDATGRRVSTWIAGTHALSEALIYSDKGPIAFRAGGSTHFQHQDYLGTARMNTGYSGATEGSFTSLPFGDGYSVSGEDWDWYHYGGLDYDPEDATQHAQNRQYSATEGRWMSPDWYYGSYSAANPQSLNRYSYVLNNPVNLVDPSGLCPPAGRYGYTQTCYGTGDSGSDGMIDGIDEFDFLSMPVYGYGFGYIPSQSWSGVQQGSPYTATVVNWGWGWISLGTGADFYNWSPAEGSSEINNTGGGGDQGRPTPPVEENCGTGLAIGLAQTGLDALGFIPGEKLASLSAKGVLVGLQVIGGDASAAISVARHDNIGIGFGALGVPLSLAGLAVDGVEGAAELIPVAGQFVAGAATLWDLGSTGYEYGKCKGWF